MGYFKNQTIDDWSPEPRPKPVNVHVSLQTRRRDIHRRNKINTAPGLFFAAGSVAFLFGVVLGAVVCAM